MRNKTAIGVVLVMMGFLALVCLPARSAAGRKARAQRITAVNIVRSVSFTVTNSSAVPGVPSSTVR